MILHSCTTLIAFGSLKRNTTFCMSKTFFLSLSQSLADGVEDGFHQFIIAVACHPQDSFFTNAATLLRRYATEKHMTLQKVNLCG